MANHVYAFYMSAAFKALYDLTNASNHVKLMLVRTGVGHYVPNFVTDQFASSVAGGDQIARTAQLTGITVAQAAGPQSVFNAANTVFTAVPAGPAGGAILLFIDTGVDATSPLIAYLDGYTGLPITPTGADINVSFNGSGIVVGNG